MANFGNHSLAGKQNGLELHYKKQILIFFYLVFRNIGHDFPLVLFVIHVLAKWAHSLKLIATLFCNHWTKKEQRIKQRTCNEKVWFWIVIGPHFLISGHCKYIRLNYDGITVYHRTSTIFRCNVPLQLNIPIATVRYTKIYSDMIVKCQ